MIVGSKNDLREVQEGDPKYLAPEVLHSSNNITCAADVFSLGMTILELATDLDLPRGGEPWHKLRNGQIPPHLVSSLSHDLVGIIMKMIEPDHLKRAKVDELLNTPRIKCLINRNRRKLIWIKTFKYFTNIYHTIKNMSLTLFTSILFPVFKIGNAIEYFRKIKPGKYSLLNNSNEKTNETSDLDKQNTSTPKKNEDMPAILMHIDDDDGPGKILSTDII